MEVSLASSAAAPGEHRLFPTCRSSARGEVESNMSGFYQLTNSTTDFKSRSNNVFDQLTSLEKQHDVHTKTQAPAVVPEDEAASSAAQNPVIPSHAITFKKRPADDAFTRPTDKWQKYDLDDVNEHHLSNRGNQHALSDFLRTRTKPPAPKEAEEAPSVPVFRRPAKKEVITNEDDNEEDQPVPIRAPQSTSTSTVKTDADDEDNPTQYKLTSIRKKTRGVAGSNEKKAAKSSSTHVEKQNVDDDDEDEADDLEGELFEP